ncbi:MAG: serine/threonine-protein kinase [Candidatus Eisenbacteria bacterium]
MRAKEIFLEALTVSPPERNGFLESACLGDQELRLMVDDLLRHNIEDLTDLVEDGVRRAFAADALSSSEGLPTRLGPFEISGLLGRGGMGVVFRARRDGSTDEFALKVLHAPLYSSEALLRFKREAEVLRRLVHPGVPRFIEAGTLDLAHGTLPYIAMEPIDGESLDDWSHWHRADPRRILGVLAAVCDTVAFAHRHEVIHRDLKPTNVLVTESGRVVVLDFGVARAEEVVKESRDLTRTGQLIGTLRYMAPELFRADTPPDQRADIMQSARSRTRC